MAFTYTYSIATDFSTGVNTDALQTQILADIASAVLLSINTNGDVIDFVYDVQPSQGDKTTLDGGGTQTEQSPPSGGSILGDHDPTLISETPGQFIRVGVDREFETIQEALDAAVDGTIIDVDPGGYPEELTLPAGINLTLRGTTSPLHETKDATGQPVITINPAMTTGGAAAIKATTGFTKRVTLQNLMIAPTWDSTTEPPTASCGTSRTRTCSSCRTALLSRSASVLLLKGRWSRFVPQTTARSSATTAGSLSKTASLSCLLTSTPLKLTVLVPTSGWTAVVLTIPAAVIRPLRCKRAEKLNFI